MPVCTYHLAQELPVVGAVRRTPILRPVGLAEAVQSTLRAVAADRHQNLATFNCTVQHAVHTQVPTQQLSVTTRSHHAHEHYNRWLKFGTTQHQTSHWLFAAILLHRGRPTKVRATFFLWCLRHDDVNKRGRRSFREEQRAGLASWLLITTCTMLWIVVWCTSRLRRDKWLRRD